MANKLEYIATIEPDVLVNELIESWINGNKRHVIYQLKMDHPGLVAMMLIQGVQDKTLSRNDCNEIANRLIDERTELARNIWANQDSKLGNPMPL